MCFLCQVVSNSGNATASIGNVSTTGSAQEYLVNVSLCVNEMNLFVGDIHVYCTGTYTDVYIVRVYVVIHVYSMKRPF